jgi:hypothetical protein
LKADRRGDVAANRAEWEWTIDRDHPDLALLRQTGMSDDLPSEDDLEHNLSTTIDALLRTAALAMTRCCGLLCSH